MIYSIGKVTLIFSVYLLKLIANVTIFVASSKLCIQVFKLAILLSFILFFKCYNSYRPTKIISGF